MFSKGIDDGLHHRPRRRLTRALLLLSLAPLAFLMLPRSSNATEAPRLLISARSLDGLSVSGQTSFQEVIRRFGVHGFDTTFPVATCRARFESLGLSVSFVSLEHPSVAGRPAECRFFFATVTNPMWETKNGFRTGLPVSALRRLFPAAQVDGTFRIKRWAIPADSTEWILAGGGGVAQHTVLVAFTRSGLVRALGIRVVGH